MVMVVGRGRFGGFFVSRERKMTTYNTPEDFIRFTRGKRVSRVRAETDRGYLKALKVEFEDGTVARFSYDLLYDNYELVSSRLRLEVTVTEKDDDGWLS